MYRQHADVWAIVLLMLTLLPILHVINILLFFVHTYEFSKVRVPLFGSLFLTVLLSTLCSIYLYTRFYLKCSFPKEDLVEWALVTCICTLSAISTVKYIIVLRNWSDMSPVSQLTAFRIYAVIGVIYTATITRVMTTVWYVAAMDAFSLLFSLLHQLFFQTF